MTNNHVSKPIATNVLYLILHTLLSFVRTLIVRVLCKYDCKIFANKKIKKVNFIHNGRYNVSFPFSFILLTNKELKEGQ